MPRSCIGTRRQFGQQDVRLMERETGLEPATLSLGM
jgi:hypothetical protein